MTVSAEGTTCPGCGAREPGSVLSFFRLQDIPVNCSALLASATEARACRKGEVELAFCRACGLIFNCSFDASVLDYDEAYDNALDHSPTFQAYARRLAARLRSRYQLLNKRIIEIGSGRGNFLKLLCADGKNQCVGYDPTFNSALTGNDDELPCIRFVQEYYSERYASEPVDFVVCRHVLEHMSEPLVFLSDLRRALAAQGEVSMYFEVPNALQIVNGPGLWDVIYQHVLYFTAESLEGVFRRAGFELLDAGAAFEDQYLWVEARAGSSSRKASSVHRASAVPSERLVADFAERFRNTVARWGECLQVWAADKKRVAFWGAGTKGVTFLNVVQGARDIDAVVDLNPRKQGMYVPGTGQLISAPAGLVRDPPDAVITLNPAYVKEIRATVRELNIRAEVVTFSTVIDS